MNFDNSVNVSTQSNYQTDADTGVEAAARMSVNRNSMPEDLQATYDMLVEKFGQDMVDQALSDNATNQFADDLIMEIKASDLPPVVQQAVIDKLSELKAKTGSPSTEVAEAVDEQFGKFIDDLSAMIMKDLIDQIQEETKAMMAPGKSSEQSSGSAKGGGKGGAEGVAGGGAGGAEVAEGAGGAGGAEVAEGAGGAGGAEGAEGIEAAEGTGGADATEGSGNSGGGENWLIALAKAMGEVSGKFLEKQVETGKKLGAMGGSEGSEGVFAELNAEMQAAAQMFKIAQEALATVVKTAGEGMVSVARK